MTREKLYGAIRKVAESRKAQDSVSEAYIAGFSKVAAAHGVDPQALMKVAQRFGTGTTGPTLQNATAANAISAYPARHIKSVADGIDGYVSSANPGSVWSHLTSPAGRATLDRIAGNVPPKKPGLGTAMRAIFDLFAHRNIGNGTPAGQMRDYFNKLNDYRNGARTPVIRDPSVKR